MKQRLTHNILVWFLFFALVIIAVNLLSVYQLQRIDQPISQKLPKDIENLKETTRTEYLAQQIRYYDEVLTQSARNYAFTADKKWRKRYESTESRLDQVIKEAITEADEIDQEFFKVIDNANKNLVSLEYQALGLVEGNNQEKAISILESKEYQENKDQYQTALNKYRKRREKEYGKALSTSSKDLTKTINILNKVTTQGFYLLGASLFFIFLVLLLFGRFLRNAISKPLDKLVTVIKESGKQGEALEFSSELIKRKDEIGELAVSFQKMWQDLEKTTVSKEKLAKEVELHKEAKQKINRLNTILRSISEINQMLINVDNRKTLISKTCQELINIRGYQSAWIVLFNEQGKYLDAASAGLGDEFNLFKNNIKAGNTPRCLNRICNEQKLFQIDKPDQTCKDCPLYKYHQGVKTIVTCLQLEGNIYGALTVVVPKEIEIDSQELSLLREISGDISLGLHHLEVEEKRRLTENELKERVKEFSCLSNLASIVEEPDISLEGILAKTVKIIPPALRYSSSACARLKYKDREYQTENFKKTNCNIRADIFLAGDKMGFLEAFYSQGIEAEKGECPFLREEKVLLKLVVERLGRIIERKRAGTLLEETEEKFRTLVNNVPGVIYRCANDSGWTMSYISEEIKDLSGYPVSEFVNNKVRSYASIIYKQDKQKVNGAIQSALEKRIAYRLEYRIVNKNSEIKWVGERGQGVYDQTGKLIWLDGAIFDITPQKKAEQELKRAIKLKSDFLSTVSHELRTPLAAIKEGINIVYDQSAGDINKEQKEFLNISKRNVDRLARLINDVLDIQKLESGKMDFNFKENDLNNIIEEVFETMKPHAAKKELEFKLDLDENIPKIEADRDKLIQVITNLVSNAIKFTEQGSITINSLLEKNVVKVWVKDTGPGIKKEDIAKLFKTFQQLQTGKGRKTGGTGLGLAICKDIINKHRGKIWVESESGKGSKFIFLLPVKERRA